MPQRLVVGGRNLGGATDAAARFTLTLAGRAVDTWDVAPNPGFFLRSLVLPASPRALAGPAPDRAAPILVMPGHVHRGRRLGPRDSHGD